jgi:hypothetical protein
MARLVNWGDPIPTHRRAYFDVRLLDGITPSLVEANGQPQISINGGGWNNAGIAPLAAIGNGRYYADLDVNTVSGNVGDVIETRYQGATTAETPGDSFQVTGEALAPAPITGIIPSASYGGIADAAQYFLTRLNTEAWDNADDTTRQKALIQATRLIDRLNFEGDKTDPKQTLQFPRSITNMEIDPSTGLPTQPVTTADTVVPLDIQYACYEIAIQLLDGVDPDWEVASLAQSANKISSLSTSYNRGFVEEHIRAGIPSYIAWTYLKPYMRDTKELLLSRVN